MRGTKQPPAPTRVAAGVGLMLCVAAGTAHGASIDVGDTDFDIRWDNSIRYNLGVRANKRSSTFYDSASTDETDHFKRGQVVTDRIDLLSEFDLQYRGLYGLRVSGAGWTDFAYGKHTTDNPALPATATNYQDNEYNGYARKYVVGPGGEVLDAFVFGSFDIGRSTLSLRAGRHTVFWGESTFTTSNSIAYSQGAIDTIKAATSPGAEAKELYLPRNQLSAQWSIDPQWSVSALYALQWDPYRLVPGGTYFASADSTRADYFSGTLRNGRDLRPGGSGDLGLNLRWSPDWLDGTIGLYYRRFDEKLPTAFLQRATTGTTGPTQLRFNFMRDTKLFGLSANKDVGPVAVGSEISYRKDSALNSSTFVVTTPDGIDAGYRAAEGARGDTLHGLVNGTWLLPKTLLWDGGTLVGELNGSHLLRVTRNPTLFKGVGYAGCPAGQGKSDGCSTRDGIGANVSFIPTWSQVAPSFDLSTPATLAYQIRGNGAALGGGNEGMGTWSLALDGTLNSKYEFILRYTGTHIRYKTSPTTGLVTTANNSGNSAVQDSHGWISFTFKTSL